MFFSRNRRPPVAFSPLPSKEECARLGYRVDTTSSLTNAQLTVAAIQRDGRKTESQPPQADGSTPITAEKVLEIARAMDRRSLHAVLHLGYWINGYLARQPQRAAAIAELGERFSAAGLVGIEARPGLVLQIHWAVRLLAGDAQIGHARPDGKYPPAELVGKSVARQLVQLVVHDLAAREFHLRAPCAEAASRLWAEILAKKPTAAWVRSEVQRILPLRIPRPTRRQGSFQRDAHKLLLRAQLAELDVLEGMLAQRRAELRKPEQAVA
jgi:hypothetical protein